MTHRECFVQFWTPQYERDVEHTVANPGNGYELWPLSKGYKCLSGKMKLRELVFFSLEKRSLSRDLINVYGHKLKYGTFPLNTIILL